MVLRSPGENPQSNSLSLRIRRRILSESRDSLARADSLCGLCLGLRIYACQDESGRAKKGKTIAPAASKYKQTSNERKDRIAPRSMAELRRRRASAAEDATLSRMIRLMQMAAD